MEWLALCFYDGNHLWVKGATGVASLFPAVIPIIKKQMRVIT